MGETSPTSTGRTLTRFRATSRKVNLDVRPDELDFDTRVFPWDNDRKGVDNEFHRLRREAGIHLLCHENHEHTDACYGYGFHDLRRVFASMSAGSLSTDALRALMRHKGRQATMKCANLNPEMDEAIQSLAVPEVSRNGLGRKSVG